MWTNSKSPKLKVQISSKIFENFFGAPDHWHKDIGIVDQFAKTTIFIHAPMKKTY